MSSAVLTPQARRDLREAARWIAQENPTAARNLRDAILKAARMLGEHPQAGRMRSEITSSLVRFYAIPGTTYIVVYDDKIVPPRILRLLHEVRDLPEILKDH